MGLNQSLSCHAASSCAVIPTSAISWGAAGPPYTASIKDGSAVVQTCAAAKVLLLDGRVLHFTGSATALQVLAGFRNHCLCPLDSISAEVPVGGRPPPPRAASRARSMDAQYGTDDTTITTFFRPVCLKPNDLLRPICVYILLPRKTLRLFATAAAAATRSRGVDASRLRRCSAPNSSRVCDSAYCTSTNASTYSSAILSKESGIDVWSSCASKVHPKSNGLASRDASTASRQAHEASDKLLGATLVHDINSAAPNHPPCSSNHVGRIHRNRAASQTGATLGESVTSVRECPSTTISSTRSSHNTPHRSRTLNLHRTGYSQYQRSRPLAMRQCRSWRPRLQAINEVQAYS